MEMREVAVRRVERGIGIPAREWVIQEKKYRIMVNGRKVALLTACSEMLEELAVGHVVGRGLSLKEISGVDTGENTVNIVTERPVDVEQLKNGRFQPSETAEIMGFTVRVSVILRGMSKLQTVADAWRKTHGVHSAALFSKDGVLLSFAEDVSRHSAFEKAIGKALLEGIDFSKAFVAISGRIDQEMVIKARNVGISIIASHSTVIEPAVTTAAALGVTLIGFVRGDHVVVFSHPERVDD